MSKTKKTNKGAWRLPALAAGLTLSATAAALAAPGALPHDVRPASGWSSVIVKTAGPLSPAQAARVAALGGDVTRHLSLIHSLAVRVPTRNLAKMAALPFVSHVSPNDLVTKCDEFTVGSSGDAIAFSQYGLTGKGVTVVVIDSGISGVPDLTGATPVQVLSMGGNRLLPGSDLAPPATPLPQIKGQPTPPQPDKNDPCGHGTHVAGIIAGNANKSGDSHTLHHFYGIAPQANVVSVRVLDQNGRTDVGTAIAGIQWVVDHQYDKTFKLAPIRVINLSLGHPVTESYKTDPLCQAVEGAWKAGIVVVCAAGNNGRQNTTNDPTQSNEGWGTAYGSIQSPGNDPYVITVGATKNTDGNRAHDKIATYSSRGPSRLDLVLKPDIIAPGNRVISLTSKSNTLYNYAGGVNQIPLSYYTTNAQDSDPSNCYFRLSGTSMASPVVAGAAALLFQADPTLTPDTVKARLLLSADKWADPTGSPDPLTYGAGYLNIPAALASTAKAALPALSPTLVQNGDGTVSLVMDRAAWGTTTATLGSRAAWGTGLWGTGITDLRAAWGTSINADRAAWGTSFPVASGVSADRAAWGTNTLTSSRAAWGTSAVWSDRAAWGTYSSAVDLTSTAIQGE